MSTDERLSQEIKKWKDKLAAEMKNVGGNEEFMKNIHAYESDTDYFYEKGDLVRAFEAVVWAWAWLEIGLKIGELRKS